MEGFYPLGEKIDNTGQVKDLSGNGFHGQLKDQNKNNATTITASQNYEIRLSSSLPANNRSSYFGRDRFVEVGYQEKLNPEKFTLIGWMKPNNDLHTMEGILSSEYNSTGYGLYRWIYRSYTTSNSRVSSHNLTQRNGSSITNANGRCRETEFQPNVNTSPGPGGCDSVHPNNSNYCTDIDYFHQFAWTSYGPYENSTPLKCRDANQSTRLFEFWTRPNATIDDTSGTGLGKPQSSIGFDSPNPSAKNQNGQIKITEKMHYLRGICH